MIQPKELTIETTAGDKTFLLSKFPAVAGREIVAKYPLSGLPKLGDYAVNEETMLKLMAYVGVPREGTQPPLMLTTRALVDNHVPDWEALAKLEIAMLEYNCSFFGNGKTSLFFANIAQDLRGWIISMLTGLSVALSKQESPPSTN